MKRFKVLLSLPLSLSLSLSMQLNSLTILEFSSILASPRPSLHPFSSLLFLYSTPLFSSFSLLTSPSLPFFLIVFPSLSRTHPTPSRPLALQNRASELKRTLRSRPTAHMSVDSLGEMAGAVMGTVAAISISVPTGLGGTGCCELLLLCAAAAAAAAARVSRAMGRLQRWGRYIAARRKVAERASRRSGSSMGIEMSWRGWIGFAVGMGVMWVSVNRVVDSEGEGRGAVAAIQDRYITWCAVVVCSGGQGGGEGSCMEVCWQS